MGQYQAEAIILSVRDWQEADRMITLLSRDQGKISAIAYGARRTRSRLAGSVQTFAHVDISLLPGKNIDSVAQCEVRRSFRELREDLNKMAYASLLSELGSELWPEREPEPAAFEVLLGAMGLMLEKNPRLVTLAGAWQLLSLAGFHPEYEKCVTCGQVLDLPVHFDAEAGGGICLTCDHSHPPNFDEPMCAFIDHLLNVNWKNPAPFKVSGAALMKAERLLIDFIAHRLDKPLKSVAFIQHMMLTNP